MSSLIFIMPVIQFLTKSACNKNYNNVLAVKVAIQHNDNTVIIIIMMSLYQRVTAAFLLKSTTLVCNIAVVINS